MRIVHFASFAPCACGLYEAARDMVIADRLSGHETYLVDVGITTSIKGELKHEEGAPGKKDNRGGTEIISEDPSIAYKADVLIFHTGVPDNWIVQCQAPIIWILHGRPLACFRPEQFGSGNSYSLIATIARWPRVKAIVTFWQHHIPYWLPIIPSEKLVCFPAPPIDEKRFCKDGEKHDFKEMGGKWNIMLAESWREDVDMYEIVHGAIEFAKTRTDIKFHFYGLVIPFPACWELLVAELRKLNALGELWARRENIQEIYHAVDILLSPQRIITRTIGEALSCGTPVIAANGCAEATWTTFPDEPFEVADTLKLALSELEYNKENILKRVQMNAKVFSLANYSLQMNQLYKKVTNQSEVPLAVREIDSDPAKVGDFVEKFPTE